jgi:hypothetical protein
MIQNMHGCYRVSGSSTLSLMIQFDGLKVRKSRAVVNSNKIAIQMQYWLLLGYQQVKCQYLWQYGELNAKHSRSYSALHITPLNDCLR